MNPLDEMATEKAMTIPRTGRGAAALLALLLAALTGLAALAAAGLAYPLAVVRQRDVDAAALPVSPAGRGC